MPFESRTFPVERSFSIMSELQEGSLLYDRLL
jgi:hypothetical protein